jgi:hypothetical protein
MAWPIAARAQQSAMPDIKTPDTELPCGAIQFAGRMIVLASFMARSG